MSGLWSSSFLQFLDILLVFIYRLKDYYFSTNILWWASSCGDAVKFFNGWKLWLNNLSHLKLQNVLFFLYVCLFMEYRTVKLTLVFTRLLWFCSNFISLYLNIYLTTREIKELQIQCYRVITWPVIEHWLPFPP